MVSLFSSLNMSANALGVNESAISVVSHNVANMNTEGYSKQQVNLATRNISGAIGNNVEAQIRSNGGVMIASVTRYNDAYLNNYYRQQNSLLNQYQSQLDGLDDLADVFNELDGSGLQDQISAFYDALDNLNEYPSSSTARTNFIETAKSLTSLLNTTSGQLSKLTSKVFGDGTEQGLENSEFKSNTDSYNDLLTELAAVNKSLQLTQTGTLTANNLLDQRDSILNEISEYMDINVKEETNGSVEVYVGDTPIVQGTNVLGNIKLSIAESDGSTGSSTSGDGDTTSKVLIQFVDGDGNVTVDDASGIISGGKLGGMLASSQSDDTSSSMNPTKAMKALDNIASMIASTFNDLNTASGAYCIDSDNTSQLKATWDTNYIFVNGDSETASTEGITASNIKVSDELFTDKGCWNIACASFTSGDVDLRAIGNAQNVVNMINTRNTGYSVLGNSTLEDYYQSLVGKIASTGNNLQTLIDTQQAVTDSIADEINSNNSVDLNEELVNLVKYQTAYSASAHVFNVVNECLETVVNLGA